MAIEVPYTSKVRAAVTVRNIGTAPGTVTVSGEMYYSATRTKVATFGPATKPVPAGGQAVFDLVSSSPPGNPGAYYVTWTAKVAETGQVVVRTDDPAISAYEPVQCPTCQVCVSCQAQCQTCQSCVACQACYSGVTQPSTCATCQKCVSCQATCQTCQSCYTWQGTCGTCQVCYSCEKCDVWQGRCGTCQKCNACEYCNVWQCTSCQSCQKCYSSQAACTSCQKCVSCQYCYYKQYSL